MKPYKKKLIFFKPIFVLFGLFYLCACGSEMPPKYEDVQKIFKRSDAKRISELTEISVYFDRSGSMIQYARDKSYINLMTKFALTLQTSYIRQKKNFYCFDSDIREIVSDHLMNEIFNPDRYRGDTDIKRVIGSFSDDTTKADGLYIVVTDGIPMINYKPDILGTVEQISKWIVRGNDFYLLGFQNPRRQFYMFIFGDQKNSQRIAEKIKEDVQTIENLQVEYLYVPGSDVCTQTGITMKVDKESADILMELYSTSRSDYKCYEIQKQKQGLLNVQINGKVEGYFSRFYRFGDEKESNNINLEILSIRAADSSKKTPEKDKKFIRWHSTDYLKFKDETYEGRFKIQVSPLMRGQWYVFQVSLMINATPLVPSWIGGWSTDNAMNPGNKTPYLYDFAKKLMELSCETKPHTIGSFYLSLY